MAYTKTTWVNGTAPALNATNMNKIEQGIADALPIDGSAPMTAQLVTVAGSATTPAIAPTGDSNNGIYFPAADTVAFTTSGTEKMRLTSDGKLGVGVTPNVILHTKSTGEMLRLETTATTGDNYIRFYAPSATTKGYIGWTSAGNDNMNINNVLATDLLFHTTNAERMRITAGGNVGIGITNPSVPLHVYSAAGDSQILAETNATGGTARITLKSNGAGGGNFYLMTGDTTSTLSGRFRLWDSVAGAERITVLPSGNVGIGATSPSYQLQVSTDSAAKPSTNTWTIASDERVKKVTGEYTKGLDAICALRPITYEYNGKAGFIVDGKENISIIAQEAIEHFPECVGTFNAKLDETDEEETELYNWNGHAITFALINAVKELKAEVETLKAQINQ